MSACPLHTLIPICISRKKPRGFDNQSNRPVWYEEETWTISLNGRDDDIHWADRVSAETYGNILHGEIHGAKTLDQALHWKG